MLDVHYFVSFLDVVYSLDQKITRYKIMVNTFESSLNVQDICGYYFSNTIKKAIFGHKVEFSVKIW
jgi:hypothetical protein